MEETTIRSLFTKLDKLQAQVDVLKKENASLKDKVYKAEQSSKINELNIKSMQESMNKCIDPLYKQEDRVLSSDIKNLEQKMERGNLSFTESDSDITIDYVNYNGEEVKKSIIKPCADNETIGINSDGKFEILNGLADDIIRVENSKTYITQLKDSNSNLISADKLADTISNVSIVADKINRLNKQFSTANGYLSSNNFKTATPTQNKLSDFAISCLSDSEKITKEQIPNGTKIKNTFDNHVWVFNRYVIDGLTSYKWEDFGADNICIASNNGVHGVVTGSTNKYEGHIDLKGVITINGLKEEIEQLTQGLLQIKCSVEALEAEKE